MASPLVFNPIAYETVFLHAARFGSYQVDGLLIGATLSSGARVVHEALPLFHGPGPFGPMLELAFVMVPLQMSYNFVYMSGSGLALPHSFSIELES